MNEQERKDLEELKRQVGRLEKKSRLKRFLLIGIVIAIFPVMLLYSDAITKPHDFTDGTLISAAEVNANFDTLYTKVNALDTSVNQLSNYAYEELDTSFSTTSTTYVDVTGLSATITTTGGELLVTVSLDAAILSGGSAFVYLRGVLDGTPNATDIITIAALSSGYTTTHSWTYLLTNITAGTHVISWQARVSSGSFLIRALDFPVISSILVEEI